MLRYLQPAGIVLLILAGCAHSGLPSPSPSPAFAGDPPPDWLTKLPREEGAVFAVGISGPTYYPDDGIRNAGDNGRIQLAHVISSRVTSATLSITTNRGSSTDTAEVLDATHDYTDTIVQFAEVVSTWVDQTGAKSSGQAGTAYALVRLNLREAGLSGQSTAVAR